MMPSYQLSLLGQEVSFKTNVDEGRIREAEKLIHDKYSTLEVRGSRLSTEKLLILVALSLADDYLLTNQRLQALEDRLERLLDKIHHGDHTV